ncbi:hypothetical protein ACWAUC_12815 [Bradyrhizobium guangdongense]
MLQQRGVTSSSLVLVSAGVLLQNILSIPMAKLLLTDGAALLLCL